MIAQFMSRKTGGQWVVSVTFRVPDTKAAVFVQDGVFNSAAAKGHALGELKRLFGPAFYEAVIGDDEVRWSMDVTP